MFEKELALANDLAGAAAEIALSFFGGDFEVKHKADFTPVTEADLAIEAMLREEIAKAFPGDAVLGEEGGMAGEGSRMWIVDPIDGTKNFADGIQVWGTLICLAVDREPALGVVGAPAIGERYEAVRGGGGARLNGEPIHVSDTEKLDDALLAFGGLEVWVDSAHREAFADLVQTVRRTRGIGDFWGHMLVARGSASVMIEPELRTWDWAALQVIVEESGGRISAFDGSPLADQGSVVSTNGLLHDEMLRRLGP